jgi:hypothetical protein
LPGTRAGDSADAFYNNGAAAGSMRNAPLYDAAVPVCGRKPASGSPSSLPRHAETTGSIAPTFTDYFDAGGTSGPAIGKNATIQVACRAYGFAVRDGDPWWYLIASSPWNSAYYASADDFFNNGSTTGTLNGTPLFDPDVPLCCL